MTEDQRRSGMGGLGEGLRTGIGILNAFREAVEETLQDSVKRGDLTPDRARQTMQEMVQRLQKGLEEARERVDFASRAELEELRAQVAALRERVDRLEGLGNSPGAAPDAPPGIIITE